MAFAGEPRARLVRSRFGAGAARVPVEGRVPDSEAQWDGIAAGERTGVMGRTGWSHGPDRSTRRAVGRPSGDGAADARRGVPFRARQCGPRAEWIPCRSDHPLLVCRPAGISVVRFFPAVLRWADALLPVLDMDVTPSRPPPEAAPEEADVFLQARTPNCGKRPIICTPIDVRERNQNWQIEGCGFRLRSTTRHPSDNCAGHHWTFRQHTGTCLAPGFRVEVNLNAFYGSATDLRTWLAQ